MKPNQSLTDRERLIVILAIVTILVSASLACVWPIGGGGGGTSSTVTDSAESLDATATFGAEQFHEMLTALPPAPPTPVP